MHPPPSVDLASMDRIYQLYSTLPTIFANDIARRQNGTARRSQSPSMSLKRDRTDEHGNDLVNKRRDTGEHKLSSLPTSPSNHPPTSFTTRSTAGSPQPVTPSVSMGPPSHLPPNADLRRQMNAMRPPMQPQQNPQPMVQPNNMQSPAAVQPTNPSANPQPTNIPPQVAALGPVAVQYHQMLQNPSNPMVQYIMNTLPGFQSLPINQQIMKMHQVQVGSSFVFPFHATLDRFSVDRHFEEQSSTSRTTSSPTNLWRPRESCRFKSIPNSPNRNAPSNSGRATVRGLFPSNLQ